MLEKTLESPLDCKEIKSVNPKGNQSSIFVGRTDAASISWNPKGNQSSIFVGRTDAASISWKLKLQYFGPLMPRANSSEETLMLGKIEGRKRG